MLEWTNLSRIYSVERVLSGNDLFGATGQVGGATSAMGQTRAALLRHANVARAVPMNQNVW